MMAIRPGSIPVDRGWAWVIVGAAFMNATILVGMFKCFGMFFAELLEMYHKSASGTSTMLALSGGLSQFIGPLVMTFSDMYTCRMVSMIGGVFCCLGFLVPAYCMSAEQIIITFGILTGLGYGMCLMPGTAIVGRYFERHRSLANGLLFSGGGVGGIVVPPVLNIIIEAYGFRSSLVIMAGFALQTVIFAALYRPPSYWGSKTPPRLPLLQAEEAETGTGRSGRLEDVQELEELEELNPKDTCRGPIAVERLYSVPEDRCLDNGHTTSSPVIRFGRSNSLQCRTSLPAIYGNEKCHRLHPGTSRTPDLGSKEIGSTASLYFSALDLASWWPAQIDQASPTDQTALDNEDKAEDKAENESPAKAKADDKKCWKPFIRRFCYAKAADGSRFPLLDFSLMKDTRFLLFLISAAFFIPIIHIAMIIPPHCLELGMTKTEVAILLSIQGGADTAGRLIAGFLGDRSFVKSRRKLLATGCFIVCSVSTIADIFLNTFWGQATYLIISSLARGAYVAMMPVVLVDLVGVENFSRALGLQAFAQAFAVTLSPVIIGALRDWTLAYTSGLIFLACCFAVSVFCFILIIAVDKRSSQK